MPTAEDLDPEKAEQKTRWRLLLRFYRVYVREFLMDK